MDDVVNDIGDNLVRILFILNSAASALHFGLCRTSGKSCGQSAQSLGWAKAQIQLVADGYVLGSGGKGP